MKVVGAEKLTSKSLAELVRDEVMRLIAKGKLQPGDRLNEVHLAEAFGISRGPIREAARELEGQGFLFSRPNQGFFVTSFSSEEIHDIYETKSWLEQAFIADLANHTDIATRRSIRSDVDSIVEADRAIFSETLFQFRLRASAYIHNRFLAELMITLYRKFYIVAVVVKASDHVAREAKIVSVLRRFWDAMIENDIEKARVIMAEDTAYWQADLLPRFAGDARDRIDPEPPELAKFGRSRVRPLFSRQA